MLKLLYAVFAGISSYFISGYLNLKLSYLTALIFFVLMLIGKKWMRDQMSYQKEIGQY